MYDEDEDVSGGFKVNHGDDDETPEGDIPADIDFGLEEENPDHDS